MRVFGLYESTPVWPAERHAPATDGFVLITDVRLGNNLEMERAIEDFEHEHRAFVEQLPRPHKLALHLGVSFHPRGEHAALCNPGAGQEPLRFGGTQGVLPPTCLLQDWAIEEVCNGVSQSCVMVEETITSEQRSLAGGIALLRVSVHVYPDQLEAELAAYLPVPIELPEAVGTFN